jgi:hypothetical protein
VFRETSVDVFISSIRPNGDLAGVFEYEECEGAETATAYFYLYRIGPEGEIGPVLDSIHIRSGGWTIADTDIEIRWDRDARRVGLFIFGTLWAAFDSVTGDKYGGAYGRDFQVDIPWDENSN